MIWSQCRQDRLSVDQATCGCSASIVFFAVAHIEPVAYATLMDGEKADLIFTDPP